MSKKKTKPAEVAKVSKETGVSEQDLNRLPQPALEKLDAMTPDEDLLGGDAAPELPTDSGHGVESERGEDSDDGAVAVPADGDGVSSESGDEHSEADDVATELPQVVAETSSEAGPETAEGVSEGQTEESDSAPEEVEETVTSESPKSDDVSESVPDSIPGDVGPAMPSEEGTVVVGEVQGATPVDSETPKSPDQVADEEGPRNDDDAPIEPPADPVVDEDAADPEMVLGEHPATGEVVRVCDQ